MDQLAAFSMTLAIELPVAIVAARRFGPTLRLWRILAVGTAASGLTHPLAWWVRWRLGPDEAMAGFFAIELAVIIIETIVLKIGLGWKWPGAAALSTTANTASAWLGALAYWGLHA